MAKIFVLGGKRAGQTVRLMGRYTFIDGVMVEEDDETAKKKANILCSMYPCEMVDHQEYMRRMAEPKAAEAPVSATPAAVAVPAKPEQPAAKAPMAKAAAATTE